MGKHLLNSFASEDPGRLAGMLETSGDVKEALAVLDQIETGYECSVVSRLSPDMTNRLSIEVPDTVVTGWLEAAPVDAGRRLLSRIDRERAARLIEAIGDRSKRRALRRLSAYAVGSIGQLTRVRMAVIREQVTAANIRAELQRHPVAAGYPVAIERDDGTVLGVLDFEKFARNSSEKAIATDFCIPVKPLLADAPLPSPASLARSAEWSGQTSLPVVDHRKRLVGFVTRDALEKASGSEKEGGLFLESSIELVKHYWEVMVYTLVLVLGRRIRR